MHTIATALELKRVIDQAKQQSAQIALVPTMGNLHPGHLTLVKRAQELADFVVVSIFINAMQFGQNEDLDAYPRTFEADQSQLLDHGVDVLFAPSAQLMYPRGMHRHTQIIAPELGEVLCGAHRPGHFSGVLTVVAKLFNLVAPDIALLGEKDWQQLILIKNMVHDLNIPVVIESVPICRESSGLAYSSRNQYLSLEQQKQAPVLYQALSEAKQTILDGDRDYPSLEQRIIQQLHQQGFTVDYVQIRNPEDLTRNPDVSDKTMVILAAAYLGKARLIDNISLTLHSHDD